jgi:hypothetical protein
MVSSLINQPSAAANSWPPANRESGIDNRVAPGTGTRGKDKRSGPARCWYLLPVAFFCSWLLASISLALALSPATAKHKAPGLVFGAVGSLRSIWALTGKARRRVYCTGLRASWSEPAYVRLFLLQEQSPLSCAWPGAVVIKRRRPRKLGV